MADMTSRGSTKPVSPEALEVFWAADIAPERRGRARLERLASGDRRLYDWVLDRFAHASAPTGEETRAAARSFGLNPGQALARLAEEDLIHTDESGRPLVAYPFSGIPRGHRVTVDGVGTVEAMCAIDALGMAAMLGRSIEISSRDPRSGSDVSVQLDPGGTASWEPQDAVVVIGSAACGGPSYRGCCDVLNLFESAESAEQYLAARPEVNGSWVSIPAAIEAGTAIFGDLLRRA
jgi:Alkylmercury lyase